MRSNYNLAMYLDEKKIKTPKTKNKHGKTSFPHNKLVKNTKNQ
jgi:hypothetical protein